LSVTLGTPQAVGLTVNGHRVAVPRAAGSDAMARFHVSRDGSVH
jgi:hypothetical protein